MKQRAEEEGSIS